MEKDRDAKSLKAKLP